MFVVAAVKTIPNVAVTTTIQRLTMATPEMLWKMSLIMLHLSIGNMGRSAAVRNGTRSLS